jgi:anhydro-N-acetylmuramic acid kinase
VLSTEELTARLRGGRALVAGVLSGTSADGIDVALTGFEPAPAGPDVPGGLGAPALLRFETLAFEPALAARLRAVLDGAACDPRAVATLGRDLGRAFGDAARTVAERYGRELDLVASHGQTIWHHDGVEGTGPATLQLGDGDFVAEAAGCAVVSDFRQADVAAGGEGAPLSALADPLLFRRLARPAAILNLGGMANLTLLPSDPLVPPLAFDTGPAGSLLDGLSRRLFDEPFDREGVHAAGGVADERLVARWLEHPFLLREPPKSTGRDTFGEEYVDRLLAGSALAPANLMATAVEFVAAAVALALARFAPRARLGGAPERLVVAGGGVHNGALMTALATRTGLPVASSIDCGIDPDAREALVFAVLGARRVLELPADGGLADGLRGPTGAPVGRCLGKLSAAPGRPGR